MEAVFRSKKALSFSLIACLLTLSGCALFGGRFQTRTVYKPRQLTPGELAQRDFKREVRTHKRLIKALYHMSEYRESRDRYMNWRGRMFNRVGHYLNDLQQFGGFSQQCVARYLKYPVEQAYRPWLRTRIACDLAGRANKLLAAFITRKLVSRVSQDAGRFNDLSNSIRHGRPFYAWLLRARLYEGKEGAAVVRRVYGNLFARLQQPYPETVAGPLVDAEKRLRLTLIYAGTRVRRFRTMPVSRSIRNGVQEKLQGDRQILRVGLKDGAFVYVRGRWGIYKERYKTGLVVLKRSNEHFCRERTFFANQNYLGGLRWARHYRVQLGRKIRIVRCR